MRVCGEQWVELIDGVDHMVKAVGGGSCSGCVFYDWYEGHLCKSKPARVCGGFNIIIKDLGILNEQGCLPAPWDKNLYPNIDNCIIDGKDTGWDIYVDCFNIEMVVNAKTFKQAIDLWNRRM